jgi:hypothetical protein
MSKGAGKKKLTFMASSTRERNDWEFIHGAIIISMA